LPAEPQPLNARTLKYWRDRLPVPAYDRDLVTPGMVHIGVGGFHRAHQAMYHDQLMNQGAGLDWGICGVGVLPEDLRMKQVLDAQDGLYTLVLKHNDGTWEPRVIGSIVEYLYAPDDAEAVIEKMAAASTRIVSLTITEGGYNISDTTGEFDPANPGVARDLQPGTVPQTVFGLVTEALRRRWKRGLAPFTLMSCDNLPGNGQLSKTVFTAFARLRDPDLADWVEREVRFPDTMVDRITPATTDTDRAEIRDRLAGRLMRGGPAPARGSSGVHRRPGLVRGPGRRPALCRRLHLGAGLAAPAGGPGDAGIAGHTDVGSLATPLRRSGARPLDSRAASSGRIRRRAACGAGGRSGPAGRRRAASRESHRRARGRPSSPRPAYAQCPALPGSARRSCPAFLPDS